MFIHLLFLSCTITVLYGASVFSNVLEIPTFSKNYVVKGFLMLPYAEIEEPFVAYFDESGGKSRIDYYNGMVKTYQRTDLGTHGRSYKLAYMPDESGVPQRNCFEIDGNENTTVTIQKILPDLTGFKYYGDDQCVQYARSNAGTVCEIWTLENTFEDKLNRYTIYLEKNTKKPTYYQMKGYNTLLGSHYDKYEVYYTSFTQGGASDSDFVVDSGLKCRSFPGPGVEEMVSNNPMMEFMNNEDNHIHTAFEDFKNDHKKSYSNDIEHEQRKNIFRQNYRYVNSVNRAGLTYAVKINHLADFSDQEMHKLRGRLPSHGYNGGLPFRKEDFPEDIPNFVDWRLYGAVTPVKDQAVCGSCWSFGTTGTIEGAYFVKNKRSVRLSQQQLIDCSWRFENNGCDGGEDFRAYKYIIAAGGLATEDDYGSYLGADGICHDSKVPKTASITGYVNVTSRDAASLKKALAEKGPISVSIDAAHKGFSFYSHGVFYTSDCKTKADELDHSVLAVGYGSMNGQDYWIIKNSWSTYWGNDGYVLMSQKNDCGVTTAATYVLM